MGIYKPTSALPDTNASLGQDCVVLATCGGDPALRKGGGGTNAEKKDIYSLVFKRAVRGISSFRPEAKCIYVERKHKSV